MMEGHIVERIFGQLHAAIVLLTYGRARIVVATRENFPFGYDDSW